MTLVILSRRFQRDNAGALDEAAGSPDQAEAGISDFKESVVPWIKEDGGPGRRRERRSRSRCGAMRSRLRRSEEAANEHRRRVTDQMQGTQAPTVERYEVAIFDA